MKRCFICSFVFLSMISAPQSLLYAQGEAAIYGRVTAQADGSALPAAALQLESPAMGGAVNTAAGGDGHFAFHGLVPGSYTLSASREGFQPYTLQLVLKPRESRNITLELAVRGISQSVVVTAPAELMPTAYSPGSTALDHSFVEGLPLGQRNNLPDMIAASAPGMIRSHDDFVHVRGSEIALNTFINGVSFWENPHSVFSAGMSPDVVQSVNIMTGGFPAEYGNRFGGILDIVTKSGFAMDHEGAVTLGAGNALRHNAAVEYGGHSEKAAYFFYGSGFESARFISPNDARSIHDTGRGSRSFFQLDVNAGPNDSLRMVLMGDGTNFQIPRTSLDEQYRPNANASQRTRAASAVLTWNHAASPDTFVTTSFYQRWSRVSLIPGSDRLASIAASERRLSTAGLKSDLTRSTGRHTVKGGLDLTMLRPVEKLYFDGEGYIAFSHLLHLPHSHLRGPNRGPITFDGQKTGGQGSAYIQDTFQLGRALTANFGVRFDRYSLASSGTPFSPRLNAAYRLGRSGMVIHASYDHFFVPPAVESVLVSSAGLTRFLQGFAAPLPALEPVHENQVELGISRHAGSGIRAGLTGYYRTSRKPVHTVVFPDSRIYAYANFDKGKAYGMESRVEIAPDNRRGISGYVNYALSRVYLWNPVRAGFVGDTHHLDESGRFLAPMDQSHTFSSGVVYRNRRTGLWASTSFEYGSGTPILDHDMGTAAATEPMPVRVPDHFTNDVTVGMDVLRRGDRSRLSLQFNIENLTNNVYKVSQESAFSPGEYFHPRFVSASMKFRF